MNPNIIANSPFFGYQKSNSLVSQDEDIRLPEEWDYEPAPEDFGGPTSKLEARVSDFVEFAFKMPDKLSNKIEPFSFAERPYLRQIYDNQAKRVLLKSGRQCEKSTLLGNLLISYCCLVSSIRCLFVSPTNTQTKTFSKDKLDEPFFFSDHLFSWTTKLLLDNTFLKRFLNLSQVTLRYAFLNADRTRGISADLVMVDEIQDILTDCIPVIEECASHSPMKIFRYSGTPKSLDNTIEVYWNKFSTQNEWVIPCDRHTFVGPTKTVRGYWNIPAEDNIGPHSLICDRCKKPINASDPKARWASMNPDILKNASDPDAVFDGFRIPQIIVPWLKHEEILQKQKDYPRARFLNEVLALASDEGTKPITEAELRANCNPNVLRTPEYVDKVRLRLRGKYPVFAGIDWLGGSKANSHTVLTLASYFDTDRLIYFYYKRFEGQESDPEYQIQEISRLLEYWQVAVAGVDYGGGLFPNDALLRRFGANKIVRFQYSTPSRKVTWDEGLSRYLVHRTAVMSDFFNALKRGGVFELPNWEHWKEPFGDDFLSIFAEYNERTNQNEYQKTPGKTDDAYHASLFCLLASMVMRPRPDILLPHKPGT